MKKVVVLLLMFSLFMISCKTDDNQEKSALIGKWKLIEQLVDPGDGSGTFQPIVSDRIIEFFNDGTITVNGELCYLATEVGDNNSGTYELINDPEIDSNFDGEIIPSDCSSSETKLHFTLPLNGDLILWYLCIEPCGQKFVKIH